MKQLLDAIKTTNAAPGFALRAIGSSGILVLITILSQRLSPVEFGLFATEFSAAMLLSQLLGFGIPKAALRSVSLGETHAQDWIAIALLATACAALVAYIGARGFGHTAPTGFAILVGGLCLAEIATHLLRAMGRIWLALAPREVIWKAAICVFALLSHHNLPVLIGWMGICLAALAALQLFTISMGRPFGLWPARSLDLGFWLSSLASNGAANLTVFAVSIFATPSDAGGLFALLRIANLMSFPLLALNLMIAPQLAHDERRQAKLAQVQRVLLPSLAIIGIVLLLGWNAIWSLIGGGQSIQAAAIWIVFGSVICHVICGPTGNLFQMLGAPRLLAQNTVIGFVIGVGLMPILIPQFGQVGGATCFALTQIIWNALCVIQLRARFGLNPSAFCLLEVR